MGKANRWVKFYQKSQMILFIGILIVPVFYVLISGQNEVSQRENRRLNQLPTFEVSQYFDGQFQLDMEVALKDQSIGAQWMKTTYNALKRALTNQVYIGLSYLPYREDESMASANEGQDSDWKGDENTVTPGDISTWDYNILPMGNDVLKIQSTNTLIMPSNTKDQWQPVLDNKSQNINALVSQYPDIEFYVYYIETDHDVNFIEALNNHEIRDYYFTSLSDRVNTDSQSVDKLEDITDYFFATDHHWNMAGQLRGYQRIVNLLGEIPSSNVDVVTLEDAGYIGSKAKKIDDFTYEDNFGYLINRQLKYKTYVNDVEGPINQKLTYDQGYYSKEQGVNHYALCYGYDVAKLTYDFNQEDKDNLVIFAASFSNPINELIASHFNQTYVLDMRHFQRDYGEAFDMTTFMATHDVDKVLFTGYYSFHANDVFLVE